MINVEQPHLIKFDDKGLISSATDASATDARTSTKPSSKNDMCLEYVLRICTTLYFSDL